MSLPDFHFFFVFLPPLFLSFFPLPVRIHLPCISVIFVAYGMGWEGLMEWWPPGIGSLCWHRIGPEETRTAGTGWDRSPAKRQQGQNMRLVDNDGMDPETKVCLGWTDESCEDAISPFTKES